MSQKFEISVPQINIDPKKVDVTSSPAFQQQMENLRAAGVSATAAIANGKEIAAAVTKRANNMPAFELDPQVKKQLASCRSTASSVGAAVADAKSAMEAELARVSNPVRSPSAQAAIERIGAGFKHIEAVREATKLPPLKVNA